MQSTWWLDAGCGAAAAWDKRHTVRGGYHRHHKEEQQAISTAIGHPPKPKSACPPCHG